MQSQSDHVRPHLAASGKTVTSSVSVSLSFFLSLSLLVSLSPFVSVSLCLFISICLPHFPQHFLKALVYPFSVLRAECAVWRGDSCDPGGLLALGWCQWAPASGPVPCGVLTDPEKSGL